MNFKNIVNKLCSQFDSKAYDQDILKYGLEVLIYNLFTILILSSENYHQKPGRRSYFFEMTGILPPLSATLVAEKRIKDRACQTMKTCC